MQMSLMAHYVLKKIIIKIDKYKKNIAIKKAH